MNAGVWIGLAAAALMLVGGLWFAFWTPPEPTLPCSVCGAPDRNCQGRVTSACMPAPRAQTGL